MLNTLQLSCQLLLKQARATVAANRAMITARNQRIGRNTKAHYGQLVEVMVIVMVILICCFALLDRPVALQRGQMPAFVVAISAFFTRFGKSDWILIPSALGLLGLLLVNPHALSRAARFELFRWNLWLSFILAGVGLPSLAATLIKRVIGRPRPQMLQEFGLFDFQHFSTDAAFASFPSGHSTTIGALAVVITLLVPKYRAAFVIFAILVGFSRVGVGAHHPSDVIAGLAFGATGALLVAKWFASRGILFLSTKALWPVARPAMKVFKTKSP